MILLRRFSIIVSLMSIFCFIGCEKELKPAKVIVVDPVRHYYPVIQGEMMGVTYELENISDNPLFIQEVQTTCGCLVPSDDLPIVVLPHKSGFLHLDFNTIKNNGYVCHYVYCYGNFQDTTMIELSFDTNVVPNADYTRDYEQLWHEQATRTGTMREFVEGMSGQKGYYTDNNIDPRQKFNDEVQDAVDDYAF